MRRKIGVIILAGLLCCMAAGCLNSVKTADTKAVLDTLLTKEQAGEQCIYIREDDTFTDVIAESFEEEYYSLDELKTLVTEEIAAYNEKNPVEDGEAIKLVSLELKEKEAVLVLQYDSWKDLTAYSAEEEFAQAAISSAVMTEADRLEGSFIGADGEAVVTSDVLSKAVKKKYHMITASGKDMTIYLERPILCVSDNVTVIDEYTVQVTADESIIVTR